MRLSRRLPSGVLFRAPRQSGRHRSELRVSFLDQHTPMMLHIEDEQSDTRDGPDDEKLFHR
jgi:hypothetical protein